MAFPAEITLDTNVLARYLLGDSPSEARRAETLLRRRATFHVSPTVLLELGWVLAVNECSPEQIRTGIEHLMTLPGFDSLACPQTRHALDWFSQGLDWADAIHLAYAPEHSELFTFDQKFVARSRRAGAFPVVRAVL